MRAVLLFAFLSVTIGCAPFHRPEPSPINGAYYEQIREWQMRIKQEGWSRSLLDSIVDGCLKVAKYRTEEVDHWDTPGEFIRKGYQGDCEDIAVFIMATLKNLRYNRDVRVLAVETPMGDHALLKVRMLDGTWKNYETAPVPIGQIDRLFHTPIVEFDENHIIYYQNTNS